MGCIGFAGGHGGSRDICRPEGHREIGYLPHCSRYGKCRECGMKPLLLASGLVVSRHPLVMGILTLIIVGIILWLLLWLVGKSPIPDPFKSVLTWVLYVVGVLVLINFLLSL